MSPSLVMMLIGCGAAVAAADKAASPAVKANKVEAVAVQEKPKNKLTTDPAAQQTEKDMDGQTEDSDSAANAFDGFGQIAAEMERASLKESAKLLKSNKKPVGKFNKDCPDDRDDESRVAETRAQVSALIAKAARPDLVERVTNITVILQQLERDLETIRARDGLTPETIALVELSILKEREALLESAGLKPTELDQGEQPEDEKDDPDGVPELPKE